MAVRRQTLGIVCVTATPPECGWYPRRSKAHGWSDVGHNEIINPDGPGRDGPWHDGYSISCGISMVGGVNAAATLGRSQLSLRTTANRSFRTEAEAREYAQNRMENLQTKTEIPSK